MSLKKETPSDVQLHMAAMRGDEVALLRVLDSGKVHVDCKDEDGTTPLILAAAGGHTYCVMELLDQGADPNSRRLTGTTPLFFAAQGGHLDVVKILIKAGANVDTPSADGGTPLFVAAQGGHVKIVRELLDCGANVNAHMKDRATPVFISAQNGHRTVLSLLIQADAEIDIKRIDGATPLWIAAQMGQDHICKVLLQNGANVDTVRCDGATPLFKAAHKGHAAVITVLLKYRPNLGQLPNGESALHAAAMFGHMTVCKQLVAAGSDVLLKNQDGLTALQLAHQQKYTSICDYLQERIRTMVARSAKAMVSSAVSTSTVKTMSA
ncbi:ankyrin repeat domain-containing protein 29 [Drosophila gunungcola]|uniref:ankyrin repeat domain-containing protein 29 n=1 Tax=Drosophila elegans TaxID=30023 RepID=UPI0007E869BF|nr:ankyrin repeat domain-containing protein 29 [Drosophila elegans]XP_017130384.1 ankyrin repeat domain-containing protein 29 [Drosophila elegans]XP_017130385.1 ankyrin repeat domain-containing protein 29 [Drosophila elegans]XP_052853229.1 ankyrin repeat domain-containing protein 29 [Drosophila gunungcola]XP_052853230.1 ankyrin repeat domain-containing protein 29 [Drosophila gunungcola]XP_052853231.1 ankyrin repeat domain-containing protein 29 [Drosophila gunungcola]XP_052853232.1 ankyrin rep